MALRPEPLYANTTLTSVFAQNNLKLPLVGGGGGELGVENKLTVKFALHCFHMRYRYVERQMEKFDKRK